MPLLKDHLEKFKFLIIINKWLQTLVSKSKFKNSSSLSLISWLEKIDLVNFNHY